MPDEKAIVNAAIMCHETNRVYCQLLGDYSQKSWSECEDWQKSSVISGVRFYVNNPFSTPRDMHHEWCRVKYADGWKYGPVKDIAKKEHYCLVDYDQLPEEQRTKDKLFSSIVRAMMGL